MKPELCRELNKMSLELLAHYLGKEAYTIHYYYQELLNDTQFLGELNEQIKEVRKYYQKGVFKHNQLESVDWMSIQRIILYILVRLYEPMVCLETGVFYGGNTSFILNALRKNGSGKLISIDLPASDINKELRHHLVEDNEDIPNGLDTGFIIHDNLKERWNIIRGDSLVEIPKMNEKVDLYIHDSEHSFSFVIDEMNLVWDKLNNNAIILADDIDWSNGFFSFCLDKKLYPLIITDNGKSGLRARTGIVKLDHQSSEQKDVVG